MARTTRTILVSAIVTAMSFSFVPMASAQATEAVVVVDPTSPAADDAGPGTADRPTRTIARAMDLAVQQINAGTPARIQIAEGVYREPVMPPSHGQRTAAGLVVEGRGDVVISGAEVWTGWRGVAGAADTLTVAWPHQWGPSELPGSWPEMAEVVRRRELVLHDGVGLRQVMSAAEVATTPGSFFVSEATGTLTVRFPAGAAVDPTRLEVVVAPQLIDIAGWHGVTVRNLTFRGAATGIQEYAARIADSSSIRFEDVRVEWSSWGGLAVQASNDIVLDRVTTADNGVSGLDGWRVTNILVQDSTVSGNNWRGEWGGWFTWHVGSKFMATRGATFLRHRAVDNRGHGLWLDTDNIDVVIEDSTFARNLGHGIYLEANQGPVALRDSVVCDSGSAGLFDAKSDATTVEGSTIFGNASGQILHSGARGGRTFTPYDGGGSHTARSVGWQVTDNTIVATGAGQFTSSTTLDQAEWDVVVGSMSSDGNRWYAPAESAAFRLPGGRAADLAGWRSAARQDSTSSYGAPAAPLQCDGQVVPAPAADGNTPQPPAPELSSNTGSTGLQPYRRTR